jgi:hypothetical protein
LDEGGHGAAAKTPFTFQMLRQHGMTHFKAWWASFSAKPTRASRE